MDSKVSSDERPAHANLPVIKLQNGKTLKYKAFFNGFHVIIKDPEDIMNIQHRGSFGKGTVSRNKVIFSNMEILRKRQLQYRNNLLKKQGSNQRKPMAILIAPDSSDKDDSDTDESSYFANITLEYAINRLPVANLHLLHEEAFFLLQLNCLEIIDSTNLPMPLEKVWNIFRELNSLFVQNYIVYHYYKSKNWVVKSGLKFGGDYLLYKECPEKCHSSYIVVIDILNDNLQPRRSMNMCNIVGLNRLAETTGKELLLAHVIYPNSKEINEDNFSCIKSFKIKEVVFKRWHKSENVN